MKPKAPGQPIVHTPEEVSAWLAQQQQAETQQKIQEDEQRAKKNRRPPELGPKERRRVSILIGTVGLVHLLLIAWLWTVGPLSREEVRQMGPAALVLAPFIFLAGTAFLVLNFAVSATLATLALKRGLPIWANALITVLGGPVGTWVLIWWVLPLIVALFQMIWR